MIFTSVPFFSSAWFVVNITRNRTGSVSAVVGPLILSNSLLRRAGYNLRCKSVCKSCILAIQILDGYLMAWLKMDLDLDMGNLEFCAMQFKSRIWNRGSWEYTKVQEFDRRELHDIFFDCSRATDCKFINISDLWITIISFTRCHNLTEAAETIWERTMN